MKLPECLILLCIGLCIQIPDAYALVPCSPVGSPGVSLQQGLGAQIKELKKEVTALREMVDGLVAELKTLKDAREEEMTSRGSERVALEMRVTKLEKANVTLRERLTQVGKKADEAGTVRKLTIAISSVKLDPDHFREIDPKEAGGGPEIYILVSLDGKPVYDSRKFKALNRSEGMRTGLATVKNRLSVRFPVELTRKEIPYRTGSRFKVRVMDEDLLKGHELMSYEADSPEALREKIWEEGSTVVFDVSG
ncbi:MAG: hypothetical protein O7H41_00585 [Planctomycetota bacterium]|nr:hypothetical protein [Planctomycetota bacterium]